MTNSDSYLLEAAEGRRSIRSASKQRGVSRRTTGRQVDAIRRAIDEGGDPLDVMRDWGRRPRKQDPNFAEVDATLADGGTLLDAWKRYRLAGGTLSYSEFTKRCRRKRGNRSLLGGSPHVSINLALGGPRP